MAVGTHVFREAMAEAMALPDNAIEKQMAIEIFVARWKVIAYDPARDPEEMEWTMTYHEIYEQWKQEQQHEGERLGRLKGIQTSILEIYRARFQKVPNEIEAAVMREVDADKLTSWCNLFVTGSAGQIAKGVGV